MLVEVDILPADYDALRRHVNQRVLKTHAPRGRVIVGAIIVGLSVGGGPMLIAGLAGFRLDPRTMVASIVCTWLGLLGYGWFRRKEFTPATDSWMYGHKTYAIEATTLRLTGACHEACFQRAAIKDVVVTSDHLFVLFDNVTGWVIPRRAFQSESDCEAFAAAIRPVPLA